MQTASISAPIFWLPVEAATLLAVALFSAISVLATGEATVML